MNRDALARHLDQLLDVSRVRDYCPNGLQVEGRPEVARLVSGVTASVALIERAAQGMFETATALGVDAYLTGEISEQHVHLARESGVAFVAAGHHATERFGVQAVGEHLARTFGLAHAFVDIDNPV
jgi:putative NIF3 family GTP cyclohydrolase 1 type 2